MEPSPWPPHVALVVVQLLFGVNYVISKIALRDVTPLSLVAIRTSTAAAILFALLPLRPRGVPLSRRDLRDLFVYGLLGASLNQLCFLAGLARSTATNASLILVSIPLLTLLFAVLLKRERAGTRDVLGIVIGLAGAVLLILPRGGATLSSGAAFGNLVLLCGASAYALYLVLTRPILARHDPLRVLAWVFLFSALTVVPVAARDLMHLATSPLSSSTIASIAYIILGATVVPYFLNSWALVRVKSSIVAVYTLLQPIVAAWLGRVFLREQFGPHTAVAAVLVVTGVVVVGWRRA